MPRRRYYKLSKEDLNALRNASPTEVNVLLALISGILAFCGGNFLVIVFSIWLYSDTNLRTEYVFGLAILLIVGLSTTVIVSAVWIFRSILFKHRREIERRHRTLQIAQIDDMAGVEFERYLKTLLSHRGYIVHLTKASGDLGVDLVASKGINKFAIQVKRHNNKVSRRAISDAVAAMNYYNCNKAVVITNNYFTPDAEKLALSTGCILIDRSALANWIFEFQNSPTT